LRVGVKCAFHKGLQIVGGWTGHMHDQRSACTDTIKPVEEVFSIKRPICFLSFTS
jgi:hypothetical protein